MMAGAPRRQPGRNTHKHKHTNTDAAHVGPVNHTTPAAIHTQHLKRPAKVDARTLDHLGEKLEHRSTARHMTACARTWEWHTTGGRLTATPVDCAVTTPPTNTQHTLRTSTDSSPHYGDGDKRTPMLAPRKRQNNCSDGSRSLPRRHINKHRPTQDARQCKGVAVLCSGPVSGSQQRQQGRQPLLGRGIALQIVRKRAVLQGLWQHLPQRLLRPVATHSNGGHVTSRHALTHSPTPHVCGDTHAHTHHHHHHHNAPTIHSHRHRHQSPDKPGSFFASKRCFSHPTDLGLSASRR